MNRRSMDGSRWTICLLRWDPPGHFFHRLEEKDGYLT